MDACYNGSLSIFNDFKVLNGFALCLNWLRAFYRGIIGVDTDYRVVVSHHIAV
jgi:putative restriction endonuclease